MDKHTLARRIGYAGAVVLLTLAAGGIVAGSVYMLLFALESL